MQHEHSTWVEWNRAEHGEAWDCLLWATEERLAEARAERAALLAWAEERANLACGGSKPHLGPLAPGCQHCADGGWSCLFVNGRCNGACFFCPTSQDEVDVPATSTIPFPATRDYVAYVERVGITGVGLSGGEPLLTLDRSLELLRALRARSGPRLHLWLYTNGLLLTDDVAGQLADAGLDELRLDLFACGYDLDKLRTARRHLPTVTVEIPALPDHEERLREALPRWREAGLDHLNLHQLRLTPHNRRHLLARGYTFLPGPKVLVLDSELAALRLMRFADERDLGLPINYCSFIYKQRFQALAARRRLAPLATQGPEEPTAAGYLRTLALRGDSEALAGCVARLEAHPALHGTWEHRPREGRLLLQERALAALDRGTLSLETSYVEPVLRDALSYRHPFRALKLGSGRQLWIERRWAARGLEGEPWADGAPHQAWEQVQEGLLPYLRP